MVLFSYRVGSFFSLPSVEPDDPPDEQPGKSDHDDAEYHPSERRGDEVPPVAEVEQPARYGAEMDEHRPRHSGGEVPPVPLAVEEIFLYEAGERRHKVAADRGGEYVPPSRLRHRSVTERKEEGEVERGEEHPADPEVGYPVKPDSFD